MTAAQRREQERDAYNAYVAECPSRQVLDALSDKWVTLVLTALADAPRRYSELSRTIAGVSQKMLTQTLRLLERDGLVTRTITASVPVRVDYQLTPLGRTLLPVVRAIKDWSETHISESTPPASPTITPRWAPSADRWQSVRAPFQHVGRAPQADGSVVTGPWSPRSAGGMGDNRLEPLVLSGAERRTLENWAKRRKTAQGLALRARIVLACADGAPNIAVAARLGVSRTTVTKWRARFLARRLGGLGDEPRPGVPRTITDAQVEEVVVRTLEETPEGATHWSGT